MKVKNNHLKILLAAPRGFCAGVDRAIEIVKKSIEKYGAPVYVRHEIVHNKHVVDGLKKIGAIFVEEINEIAVKNSLLQKDDKVINLTSMPIEKKGMVNTVRVSKI